MPVVTLRSRRLRGVPRYLNRFYFPQKAIKGECPPGKGKISGLVFAVPRKYLQMLAIHQNIPISYRLEKGLR
jgi:hypothetical protein